MNLPLFPPLRGWHAVQVLDRSSPRPRGNIEVPPPEAGELFVGGDEAPPS